MEHKDDKGSRRDPPEELPPEDKEHLDEKLDEALEETFPASDPVAVTPKGDDSEPED